MFEEYVIDISKGQKGRIKITPKLVEQARRFLVRTIWIFHHDLAMERRSGEDFEQWHEDKAKELLAFLNMPEKDRIEATHKLSVSSSNQRRLDAVK